MRVDVTMPQMGESIAEGTITRWLKKVGDSVQRDEPLFEITTDKVDAEIPSPQAGTLVEIRGEEGETVPVNQVVAVLDTEGGAAADAGGAPAETEKAESEEPEEKKEAKEAKEAKETESPEPAPAKDERAPASRKKEGTFVSPVVRKIAAEHDVDPNDVPGTGAGGRVTKKDILAYLDRAGTDEPTAAAAPPAAAPVSAPVAPPAAPAGVPSAARTTQSDAPSFAGAERDVRVAMSNMRKKIAEHMVESKRTSAHVQSVFEIDVTRIVALRERYKKVYSEQHGTKLTFTPFFVRAACDALRAWPILNASVDGDEIVYHKDLNIGVAVALDWGLIVPVIRNADELSMVGLCKRVSDLADRARAKKLVPDEVQAGTFTITNPGVYGGLFGLPIISQPQVAILGVGGIERRPVVVEGDAIAIRSMMYVSMSYDHRVVDGAVADQFLARIKHFLQTFDDGLL